jgi:hypothetical protein
MLSEQERRTLILSPPADRRRMSLDPAKTSYNVSHQHIYKPKLNKRPPIIFLLGVGAAE